MTGVQTWALPILVMTRADRARGLPGKPAYLLGAASATWHRNISALEDLTVTAASECGPRAFAQAGVRASDIYVVRSEERRVGKEWGSTGTSEGGPYPLIKKHQYIQQLTQL